MVDSLAHEERAATYASWLQTESTDWQAGLANWPTGWQWVSWCSPSKQCLPPPPLAPPSNQPGVHKWQNQHALINIYQTHQLDGWNKSALHRADSEVEVAVKWHRTARLPARCTSIGFAGHCRTLRAGAACPMHQKILQHSFNRPVWLTTNYLTK